MQKFTLSVTLGLGLTERLAASVNFLDNGNRELQPAKL